MTPAEAIQAAKVRSLDAIIERHPASIELADQSPKAGAQMGGEGMGFDSVGNPEINQLASVVFRKSNFTGTPGRGKEIRIEGRGFLIESVAGHLEADVHWLLRCKRAPGADD